MTIRQLASVCMLIVGAACISQCGRDTGYLYENKPVQHMEPPGVPSLAGFNRLTWLFHCPGAATTRVPREPLEGETIVDGESVYKMKRSDLQNTAVYIQGEVCAPEQAKRDVVMVFDVSGSMMTNDPLNAAKKSCGRLDSFEAFMSTVNWQTTQVGLLTFSDVLEDSSRQMYGSRDDLVNALTLGGKKQLTDVVCNDTGTTGYEPAFREAEKMFMISRPQASKEIFFVSDGEPFDRSQAERTALDLKTRGVWVQGTFYPVTIATVMLGNDQRASDYLRDNYASLDINQTPIHASVRDAGKLAETLKKMSGGATLVGSSITHGQTSATNPTVVDVMPYLSDLKFELPPFVIDNKTVSQDDYEIKLQYWDSYRHRYIFKGKLELQD